MSSSCSLSKVNEGTDEEVCRLDQLYTDFPSLPTSLLKSTFQSASIGSSYFAPTYLSIHTRSKAGEFDGKLLKSKRKPVKKSTRLERDEATGHMREIEEKDEGLEKEMKWVREKISELGHLFPYLALWGIR